MLTDNAIKNALPAGLGVTKLYDHSGLYILIHQNGSKYWRLDYRILGKRKTLALGVYPKISLKQARDAVIAARTQITAGIDPIEARKSAQDRKIEQNYNTFKAVMLSWGRVRQKGFDNDKHHYRRSLELHILPYIGNKAMSDIKPRDILNCLRRVEEQGYFNVSHRLLMLCSMIFRFAVAEGIIERNICLDLKGALVNEKTKNFPSITDPIQVGELLRAIDAYSGTFQVKSALQLAPLIFIRPVELRSLEWDMIDFEKKEIRYFVSKTSVDHIVPLSSQAIEILKELHQFTGDGRYVFMSHHHKNKHIGDATLNNALRVMGYDKTQMTIHGFRAMARTLLDERLGFRPDFIELQLAHKVTGIMGATYNRSSHLKERHLMMQSYSDYLEELKKG